MDAEDRLEGSGELAVGFSSGEGLLSDLDGLEHSQIAHLCEHVDCINLAGLLVLIGLDAADEVVGGR